MDCSLSSHGHSGMKLFCGMCRWWYCGAWCISCTTMFYIFPWEKDWSRLSVTEVCWYHPCCWKLTVWSVTVHCPAVTVYQDSLQNLLQPKQHGKLIDHCQSTKNVHKGCPLSEHNVLQTITSSSSAAWASAIWAAKFCRSKRIHGCHSSIKKADDDGRRL